VNVDSYPEFLRADAERMAVAFEHGPTDAPVAACPGWDVRQLVEHMAYIHRWADFAVRNARGPIADEVAVPADDVDLASWLRIGAAVLADDLAAADSQADTWHVFPVERKMWIWARRQAHETAMHRWDAETATFGSSSLDAELASDGVHEFLELGLPRVLKRDGVSAPRSRLGIRCDDVGGDWTVWSDGGEYRTAAECHEVEATVHGTAESLLLVLMGRADRSAIAVAGDPTAADAWLSLPGW
jgi:uncharacterized protein (TIGR03083 family)